MLLHCITGGPAMVPVLHDRPVDSVSMSPLPTRAVACACMISKELRMVEMSGGQQAADQELPIVPAVFSVFLNILFGGNAVAIKFSLEGMGALTTAGLRFLIAAIAISLWAVVAGQPLGVDRRQAGRLAILALLFMSQIALFYLGLTQTTASHCVLISNLMPFVVLLFAHWYIPGDRITWRKLAGIVCGFIGVLLVVLDRQGMSADLQAGDLFILGAVIIWGMSAVYAKRLSSTVNPVMISLYPMLPAVPIFLLAGALWDDGMIRRIDAGIVLALLYQALVTASFGFIAWNTLVRRYGATALNSFVLVKPISGVFFGVVLLDEPLTPHIIAAIALIAAGIAVINSGRRTRPTITPCRD
jgi:drug/metabolite transporter (DMT)-like permease